MIRLYVCPECGMKYWPDPDKKWDRRCTQDGELCNVRIEEEGTDLVKNSEGLQ